MNKAISLLACAALCAPAFAVVNVKVSAPGAPAKVGVRSAAISALAGKGRAQWSNDSVTVTNGTFTLSEVAEPMQIVVGFPERKMLQIYQLPGEEITIDVTSLNPLQYTVSGSELMSGIKTISDNANAAVSMLKGVEKPTEQQIETMRTTLKKSFTDYISANPDKAASVFALLNLDGEDFIAAYETMSEPAKQTVLWPLAQKQQARVAASIAKERLQKELVEGHKLAPDFTLKNLAGKDVSLSSLRGKWVIIDFWGSWCRWCIKGIPDMKEAYKKYAGKLEILGVDCQESEDAWRKGVERWELPWINVYNPGGQGSVTDLYGVQGYPTKAIIDPEGHVADIIVGEDPAFYTKLAELMK